MINEDFNKEFKIIDDIVEGRNYMKRNLFKYKTIKISGITANIVNVFLMFNIVYFLFYSWTKEYNFLGKTMLLGFSTFFLLGIAEYLKRFLIYESFLNAHISKWTEDEISIKSKTQLTIALMIVIFSGFTAINGTKQLADKKETYEVVLDTSLEDELKRLNNEEKEEKRKAILTHDEVISKTWGSKAISQASDKRQSELERIEKNYKIKREEVKSKYKNKTIKQDDRNDYVVIGSYLFTLIIELTIIFSVLFETRYKWFSYLEEKEKQEYESNADRINRIKSSNEYKAYEFQKKLLKLIYVNLPYNETLPPNQLLEMSKLKGFNFSINYIVTFINLLFQIGVLGEPKYNKRPYLVNEERALEMLKSHYGFSELEEEYETV